MRESRLQRWDHLALLAAQLNVLITIIITEMCLKFVSEYTANPLPTTRGESSSTHVKIDYTIVP